mmetsp:Transcript_20031/g.55128  ORF Transcript_20031/g.55128 Transcript_20031/m.55128 type:complete len:256 (+) Transcript_20031:899-1666(+)
MSSAASSCAGSNQQGYSGSGSGSCPLQSRVLCTPQPARLSCRCHWQTGASWKRTVPGKAPQDWTSSLRASALSLASASLHASMARLYIQASGSSLPLHMSSSTAQAPRQSPDSLQPRSRSLNCWSRGSASCCISRAYSAAYSSSGVRGGSGGQGPYQDDARPVRPRRSREVARRPPGGRAPSRRRAVGRGALLAWSRSSSWTLTLGRPSPAATARCMGARSLCPGACRLTRAVAPEPADSGSAQGGANAAKALPM